MTDSTPAVLVWLDTRLPPPWSGLVVLAVLALLSGLSTWATIETIRLVFRDKP